MEMYIVIVVVPGRRQTIQNTIRLPRHNHLLQNLHHNIHLHNQQQTNLLHNHQRLKVAQVLFPSPVVQLLPVKCPALPATGRGEAPVQVPGEEVVERPRVVAEVAGVVEEEVVVVVLAEEVEEDNRF